MCKCVFTFALNLFSVSLEGFVGCCCCCCCCCCGCCCDSKKVDCDVLCEVSVNKQQKEIVEFNYGN